MGTVIAKEREARQVLMRDAGTITEDKIWRAYGLLRYARTLDYVELMNLLSGVRLGRGLRPLGRLAFDPGLETLSSPIGGTADLASPGRTLLPLAPACLGRVRR